MNILYHHRTLATDAQGVHIRAMIGAFRGLGHTVNEVSLVSSEEEGVRDEEGEHQGLIGRIRRGLPKVAYELLELYGYTPVGLRRIKQAILRGQTPDFIYERYSLGNAAGVKAGKKLNLPVIVEVNAPLALEKSLYDGLRFHSLAMKSERKILSAADQVITVTGELKRILVSQGVPEERIVVMSNGVHRGEFGPQIEGKKWRSRLGVTMDDVVVGFVGWFRPWHGLHRLIELAASRKARDAKMVVVLVGDGPSREELERQAKSLDVLPFVRFLGAQEHVEIPEILAAFDVAVQPEVTDYACPMKLIEYLAAGKAVVAPRKANIVELVEDGKSALLFDTEDEGALEEALLNVVCSATLRRQLAVEGLHTIERRGLYWDENARRVMEIARSLQAQA